MPKTMQVHLGIHETMLEKNYQVWGRAFFVPNDRQTMSNNASLGSFILMSEFDSF